MPTTVCRLNGNGYGCVGKYHLISTLDSLGLKLVNQNLHPRRYKTREDGLDRLVMISPIARKANYGGWETPIPSTQEPRSLGSLASAHDTSLLLKQSAKIVNTNPKAPNLTRSYIICCPSSSTPPVCLDLWSS